MSFITTADRHVQLFGPDQGPDGRRLRNELGVYGTDTGRMCVAALNSKNIDYVCAVRSPRSSRFRCGCGSEGAPPARSLVRDILVTKPAGHHPRAFRPRLSPVHVGNALIYCTATKKNSRSQRCSTNSTKPNAPRRSRSRTSPSAASKLYGAGAGCSQLPMAQRISAGYDLLYLPAARTTSSLEFKIKSVKVEGNDVVIQEIVGARQALCELRRFCKALHRRARTSSRRSRAQPVVLIVAPLSGHYATLLRDTVRTMLR